MIQLIYQQVKYETNLENTHLHSHLFTEFDTIFAVMAYHSPCAIRHADAEMGNKLIVHIHFINARKMHKFQK